MGTHIFDRWTARLPRGKNANETVTWLPIKGPNHWEYKMVCVWSILKLVPAWLSLETQPTWAAGDTTNVHVRRFDQAKESTPARILSTSVCLRLDNRAYVGRKWERKGADGGDMGNVGLKQHEIFETGHRLPPQAAPVLFEAAWLRGDTRDTSSTRAGSSSKLWVGNYSSGRLSPRPDELPESSVTHHPTPESKIAQLAVFCEAAAMLSCYPVVRPRKRRLWLTVFAWVYHRSLTVWFQFLEYGGHIEPGPLPGMSP